MEDMARLALVEQSVSNVDTFNKVLHTLLQQISNILENPHDQELRTVKHEEMKSYYKHKALTDYMKYIGFQQIGENFVYPKEQSLNNLHLARATIERKIYFCCGGVKKVRKTKSSTSVKPKLPGLLPCKIVKSSNFLLQEIERLFNHMLRYEDEDLLELAREHIPIVTLQLMALDRMREHQRGIKEGKIKEQDLPFDIALLMELLYWFKDKFFTWVDKPACEACGADTVHSNSGHKYYDGERCRVEYYKCLRCMYVMEFPRLNSPRGLLRTRRGRCGEWANCFALLCRALAYDTRYVYDTTDHVWCEVYDYDSGSWMHVDPCEGKLNAPLMYSHGWNKSLSYIIAVSRDDLQDVTWRYTTNHKEVLSRRTIVPEDQVISTIMALREDRQKQLSEARRRFLAKRCLQELVQLMVEKKPNEADLNGRISGSREWREFRGESGAKFKKSFNFGMAGVYEISYCCALDKYVVVGNGERSEFDGFSARVWDCKGMFRKVEKDWHMVYLARQEGTPEGSISWKIETEEGLIISVLSVSASTALYETGTVEWHLTFDSEDPIAVKLGETTTSFTHHCSSAILSCTAKGGNGANAWQHTQLFRQKDNSATPTFRLSVTVEKETAS